MCIQIFIYIYISYHIECINKNKNILVDSGNSCCNNSYDLQKSSQHPWAFPLAALGDESNPSSPHREESWHREDHEECIRNGMRWFQSSKRDRFGSSFFQNILSGLARFGRIQGIWATLIIETRPSVSTYSPLPFDSSVPRALRRADLKKPRSSSKLNIAMINSTFQSIQEIHW